MATTSQTAAPSTTPPARPLDKTGQSRLAHPAAADNSVGAASGAAGVAAGVTAVAGGAGRGGKTGGTAAAAAATFFVGGSLTGAAGCDAAGNTAANSPGELSPLPGRFQPTGGTTCTMLLHLGQDRMLPITDSSLTTSRALHVVQ